MEIELQEICDFISTIPPFDRLPLTVIESITKKITIRYIREGAALPPKDVTQDKLYIIRKGSVSLFSRTDKLLGKLGEGDICTAFCFLDEKEKFNISVEEDTLVYTVACKTMKHALEDYPEEMSYFQKSASQRLNQAITKIQEKNVLVSSLMQTPIADILHNPVITAEATISIRDAAIRMTEKNVSSLVILDNQKPVGILTDKDITKRCIARDLSTSNPVWQIMTTDIASIPTATDAFQAMMLMSRKQIRHLPVIDNNHLNGIVSVTDFLRLEGQNSFYITNAIKKATSVSSLVKHSKALPQLQLQLVQMGAAADHVGKIITAVSSAITRRLIAMAEAQLGPAPVPYAWVAAGSHARWEQSSHSDQDNALIISDEMTKDDEKWFTALANFVCEGLAKCGYYYCPWKVMATNPRWRQPAKQWSDNFSSWISTPSPKALTFSSIFFDLRTISGDEQLLENIRQQMLQQSSQNQLFLAHLTANALKLQPPLGFFRDFVLVEDGEHKDKLDLKHNGLAPIVDLARIYSLAEGIDAVNTIERLNQVSGSDSLSIQGAANLRDAFEFISTLRIKHQAQQISNRLKADNFMNPAKISKLERAHLKDTFKVIQTLQTYVEMRYKLS